MNQQNYRADPSLGGTDLSGQRAGDNENPFEGGSIVQPPWPDWTFKWYDTHEDASITTLHSARAEAMRKGNPLTDAVGWSEDPSSSRDGNNT